MTEMFCKLFILFEGDPVIVYSTNTNLHLEETVVTAVNLCYIKIIKEISVRITHSLINRRK